MNTQNTLNLDTLQDTVRDYISTKAQIADLQAREAELKAALVATGQYAIDSDEHRLVITETRKTFTDWRAVAEHFTPSRQLVQAHTRQSDPVYSIRVYGRKTG